MLVITWSPSLRADVAMLSASVAFFVNDSEHILAPKRRRASLALRRILAASMERLWPDLPGWRRHSG